MSPPTWLMRWPLNHDHTPDGYPASETFPKSGRPIYMIKHFKYMEVLTKNAQVAICGLQRVLQKFLICVWLYKNECFGQSHVNNFTDLTSINQVFRICILFWTLSCTHRNTERPNTYLHTHTNSSWKTSETKGLHFTEQRLNLSSSRKTPQNCSHGFNARTEIQSIKLREDENNQWGKNRKGMF